MDKVVKGNFDQGFPLGDRRAQALHDWMTDLGRPASVEEIKAEMARLRAIMPAPEDRP